MSALLLPLLCCTCGPALENREETDALGYRSEYRVSPETGEREGTARKYDPEGRLISEGYYVNGKLDGTRTAYYPDGKVEIVENYRDGQFEGEYRSHDSLGNLRLRGQYIDGAMGKAWTRYWPNGRVREVVTFADNRENGPFRDWHENGQASAAGSYLNGKEEGILFIFDPEGQLTAIRDCKTGVCTTQWRAEEGSDPPATPPSMTRPPDVDATN